jgi:hypothetical protein
MISSGAITKEQEQAALNQCREMLEKAKRGHRNACINCKEPFFWYEWERALIPGHVYSHSGREEVRISKVCEYCFDKMFGGEHESPALYDEGTGTVVGPIHGAV